MKSRIKDLGTYQVVSIVLVILLLISIFTSGFQFAGSLSKSKASEKALDFINTYVLTPGMTAELEEISDEGGVYKLNLDIAGEKYQSYMTKDGRLLFPTGLLMVLPEDDEVTGAVSCDLVEKTGKPEVELFVMSQCPFGSIAIKALAPAYELLKDKADFKIYFIANENEDGSFSSLHGQPEVDEDIRQVCAIKHYPDTYYDYLVCIAEDYVNAETIWEDCAKASGMSVSLIEECYKGDEGAELFSENIKRAEELGIGGSPTYLVNGEKYVGSRTPEAYKDFICCGYEDVPGECDTELSDSGAQATGSC